jgi:hypothetical protein
MPTTLASLPRSVEQDSIIDVHSDDQSRQTAEIMRRFNDVFQNHDPSL